MCAGTRPPNCTNPFELSNSDLLVLKVEKIHLGIWGWQSAFTHFKQQSENIAVRPLRRTNTCHVWSELFVYVQSIQASSAPCSTRREACTGHSAFAGH